MVKEIELTYLANDFPSLEGCKSQALNDLYLSDADENPKLRIRQKGSFYEITQKTQIDPKDVSIQEEQTIYLTEQQYNKLTQVEGRAISKTRYYMDYQGFTLEIDVFSKGLEGLVVIECEFHSEKEKNEFKKPDFCGADVTQEGFMAGSALAGRTYQDIANDLERLGYRPLLSNVKNRQSLLR